MIRAALLLSLLPAMAGAEGWVCAGPGWDLEVSGRTATLDLRGARHVLDHPEGAETRAEGGWPRALTLIGTGPTGILVLHRRQCGEHPVEATFLTQSGTQPLVLPGCCEPAA